MSDVTRILSSIERGDPHAADQLLPLVYDELRKLATAKLAREKPGQTLQPTSLVHEAHVRPVGAEPRQRWDSRAHFFAARPKPCALSSSRTCRGGGAPNMAAGFSASIWKRRSPTREDDPQAETFQSELRQLNASVVSRRGWPARSRTCLLLRRNETLFLCDFPAVRNGYTFARELFAACERANQ